MMKRKDKRKGTLFHTPFLSLIVHLKKAHVVVSSKKEINSTYPPLEELSKTSLS